MSKGSSHVIVYVGVAVGLCKRAECIAGDEHCKNDSAGEICKCYPIFLDSDEIDFLYLAPCSIIDFIQLSDLMSVLSQMRVRAW